MTPKLRILIVGAGRRVKNNHLPALKYLEHQYEIQGIYSRTFNNALEIGNLYSIRAFRELDEINFESIDIVLVSVSYGANADVLSGLALQCTKVAVILDTPAVTLRSVLAISRLAKRFTAFYIAEDFMSFPQFEVMRRHVQLGYLGKVLKIRLINCGYSYHGSALIRSFVNFENFSAMHCRWSRGANHTVQFIFKGDIVSEIIYPYTPESGCLEIVGDKGRLYCEFGEAHAHQVHGDLIHFEDDGYTAEYYLGDTRVGTLSSQCHIGKNMTNKTRFNLDKTQGMITILNNIYSNDGLSQKYLFSQGAYDAVCSILYHGNLNNAPGVSLKFWIMRNVPVSFVNLFFTLLSTLFVQTRS